MLQTVTYSNKRLEPYIYPEDLRAIVVKLAASKSLARGTVLGEVTATPGVYDAYSDISGTGLQVARAILPWDIQTDASGNIIMSETAGTVIGQWGEAMLTINVYIGGFFKTAELVGLDAAAVADLGRLIQGSVADGILYVG